MSANPGFPVYDIAETLKLIKGSQSVGNLRVALSDLSGHLATVAARLDDAPANRLPLPNKDALMLEERLKNILKLRRLRENMFAQDIFGDPAWDILLDLALARMSDKEVSVSSLCIAAAVPTTTALRWIKRLIDHGIIERWSDPLDGRRAYVRISDKSFENVVKLLTALK